MEIADLRKKVAALVGPRGHMVPDWVTIKRWKKKIEERGISYDEGIRQLLELHYGESYGAMEPVISAVEIVEKTGLSKGTVLRIGGDKFFKWGKPKIMLRSDYEKLFSGGING